MTNYVIVKLYQSQNTTIVKVKEKKIKTIRERTRYL